MYFSEYIPVIKHRMTVLAEVCETHLRSGGDTGRCRSTESMNWGQLKNPPATLPIWGLSDNLPT